MGLGIGKKQLIICVLIITAIALTVGHLCTSTLRDPDVPFLQKCSQADWILYHLTPDTALRAGNYVNLTTEFTRSFTAIGLKPEARLHLKSFKKCRVLLNDKELLNELDQQIKWKDVRTLDISKSLRTGVNRLKVQVSCDYGPPAFWLYSTGLGKDFKTDDSWTASISGSPAILATIANDCVIQPIAPPHLAPANMLIKKMGMLVIFFAVSLALFVYSNYRQKNKKSDLSARVSFTEFSPKCVLKIAIILWALLFIINTPQIPSEDGYDTDGHYRYVSVILEQHRFPLANEGWETYQPPLFYLASAVLLGISQIFLTKPFTSYLLKVLPFLCGIGQIYLVYLASRIIFPKSRSKQSLATLIAAILPMNIYMSQYFSNEPLSAFLMGLTILMAIKMLDDKDMPTKSFYILGLIAGLALLTKFTVLAILPVIFAVLAYKMVSDKKCSIPETAGELVWMGLVIALVAGWFYMRNWKNFGQPIVGNWHQQFVVPWWQDPGYHTSRYFLQFGKVFSQPYFAGFYSLWDSVYATFWGDGFLGGAAGYHFRTPWNYEYTSVVYLLSIPATIMILTGLGRGAYRVISGANEFWLLLLGVIFVLGYSLVYANLRIPVYAQAKAFYALGAILPISLAFAFGFDGFDTLLKNKNLSIPRAVIYGWLGTFIVAIFLSYVVKPSQAPLKLTKALEENKLDEAVLHYQHRIENDPGDHVAHYQLARIYNVQKRFRASAEEFKQALKGRPQYPWALNNLALTLIETGDANEALKYAKQSCQLTGYLSPEHLAALARAYAATGNFPKAVEIAEKGAEIAELIGNKQLAHNLKQHLQRYKRRQK